MGKSITDLSSVTRVGLDLAKHVFQVHGVDTAGEVVFNKAIKRHKLLAFFAALPRCLVGLEACGSAHHWTRELIKLGHDARMMPAAYVKAYVRRQKNDAADAAAICEAVSRPSMRFVAVRSVTNHAELMRHKAREMLVAQRTQVLNGLRGHLGEVGVIAAQGPRHARELAGLIEACDESIPLEVCAALSELVHQLHRLDEAIDREERPGQRDIATVDDHSRNRADYRLGHRRRRAGCCGLLWPTRIRRLSRPDAPPAFVGRQRAPRAYLEDGQPIPTQAARRGRARRAVPSQGA
jgi:transposase